jgi:hypothetical protein
MVVFPTDAVHAKVEFFFFFFCVKWDMWGERLSKRVHGEEKRWEHFDEEKKKEKYTGAPYCASLVFSIFLKKKRKSLKR